MHRDKVWMQLLINEGIVKPLRASASWRRNNKVEVEIPALPLDDGEPFDVVSSDVAPPQIQATPRKAYSYADEIQARLVIFIAYVVSHPAFTAIV